VNYVFVLKFPATKKYPRQYKSFDIAGPFITNVFADMDGTVDFENVSINSRNASTYVGVSILSAFTNFPFLTHTFYSLCTQIELISHIQEAASLAQCVPPPLLP
jgi:hypothetical protein